MRHVGTIRRNVSGGVAIITAASIALLVAVSGAGIDFGRYQLVKSRAQQALTAAAIAVAAMPDKKPDGTAYSLAEKQQTFARYFSINYPTGYLGVSLPQPSVAISGDTVSANLDFAMPTSFLSAIGLDSLRMNIPVAINSNVTSNSTAYDILFVLDNSGSMSIADVGAGNIRPAPSARIGQITGRAWNYCDGFYRSIPGWLSTFPGFPGFRYPIQNFIASTCVSYRGSDYGATGNTRLNALRYAAHTFATNTLSQNADSQVGAVTFAFNEINTLPLSNNLAASTDFFDSMFAMGATNSYAGFLSAQQLASKFNPAHVRAIIYITDGINTIAKHPIRYNNYISYPNGPRRPVLNIDVLDEYGCGNSICRKTDELTLTICNDFKARGTQIYTIAFGNDINNVESQNFMKACASDSKNFFIAPDANSLSKAFDAINTSIKKIKITQ